MMGIRLLTSPKKFLQSKLTWLESGEDRLARPKLKSMQLGGGTDAVAKQADSKPLKLAKEPDDLIIIR